MKIYYWSDIACPFCYIGSHNLKRAIHDLGLEKSVPLKFLSYQLDPTLPKKAPEEANQEINPRMKQIEDYAEQSGLQMNLSKVVHVNSMDAHRLIKLAYTKSDELANKLINKLYNLYFVQGQSIADHAVLKKAAVNVGLDANDTEQVLNSDQFEKEVRKDEMAAQRMGVQGVPFFVINDKYALNGAQPYKVMLSALKQVQAKEAEANE